MITRQAFSFLDRARGEIFEPHLSNGTVCFFCGPVFLLSAASIASRAKRLHPPHNGWPFIRCIGSPHLAQRRVAGRTAFVVGPVEGPVTSSADSPALALRCPVIVFGVVGHVLLPPGSLGVNCAGLNTSPRATNSVRSHFWPVSVVQPPPVRRALDSMTPAGLSAAEPRSTGLPDPRRKAMIPSLGRTLPGRRPGASRVRPHLEMCSPYSWSFNPCGSRVLGFGLCGLRSGTSFFSDPPPLAVCASSGTSDSR